MRIQKKGAKDGRNLRAKVLRQAAQIAESETSLLTADYWNLACHRISRRLEALAAQLEAEVAETPKALERKVSTCHPYRVPTTRGRGRFSW